MQVEDGRSRRIVVVIECVLNQNARDPGAATFPAMSKAVVRLCAAHDVGIVQIPCPEMAYLGLQRRRPKGTSIREALDTPGGRECCARLAEQLADRLFGYVASGYRVLAVLGGNAQSPGCAVVAGSSGRLATASGILMQALESAFAERQLAIPFRGIRDLDPKLEREDLDWLIARLEDPAP
ncbi:MAG: hypothetical protein WAM94_13200 [Chromatiaceae bacterium]